MTPRAGANMGIPLIQQLAGSNTPSCISAIRDAYKSGTKAPTSSAPPARTHTPLFLQVCQHSALRLRLVRCCKGVLESVTKHAGRYVET